MENGAAQRAHQPKGRIKRSSKSGSDAGRARKKANRRRGIDRVIQILEFLYAHDEPIRPNQIALAVKAPRSTVYEVINRLIEARLLEFFDNDGRVFLGRRLHYFGASYVKHYDLMREADQTLRGLTERTNATSQLCVMESGKYIVVQVRQGGHHFRISADLGRAVPLPWTASGPLLVSDLSDEDIMRLIPEEDFTAPSGRQIDPAGFLRSVRLARKRGLWRQNGVMDTFIHCLAAPVLNADGKCIATLCLVIPRDEAERRGEQLARVLASAAANLTQCTAGTLPSDLSLRPVPSRGDPVVRIRGRGVAGAMSR
jgi:DNA-binding IclR family transcriptional regulator